MFNFPPFELSWDFCLILLPLKVSQHVAWPEPKIGLIPFGFLLFKWVITKWRNLSALCHAVVFWENFYAGLDGKVTTCSFEMRLQDWTSQIFPNHIEVRLQIGSVIQLYTMFFWSVMAMCEFLLTKGVMKMPIPDAPWDWNISLKQTKGVMKKIQSQMLHWIFYMRLA